MSAVELFAGHVAPLGLGTLPHEDVMLFTGMELLTKVIAGDYPAPPMAAAMNFALTDVAPGRAVFRGLPGAAHLNPLGTVHGGWAATIMDSALGCAIHSTLDKGEGYATVEFKVNLTRPISPHTGIVTCEGRVVHKGRTLAVSEASLKDDEGRLLAFGTETCSIFPIDNLKPRQVPAS